jgi:hypothetical protein
MHDAFPHRSFLVGLFDWHGLHTNRAEQRCRPSIAFCNWSVSISTMLIRRIGRDFGLYAMRMAPSGRSVRSRLPTPPFVASPLALAGLEPNSCILIPRGYAMGTSPRTKRPRHKGDTTGETPREIIGDESLKALEQAGYVVIRRSEMAKLRASLKSLLDSLGKATAKAPAD